jgi:predicted NAD-dependent protein-ADP-ribosyltransferase YbiA (DUF1768 family)
MSVATISSFKSEFSFLAPDYPCRIDYRGDLYPTLQHAFLAAMTTSAVDKQYVRRHSSPSESLKRSRKVRRRPDWEAVEGAILWDLTRIKFAPGGKLAQKLLDTGDALLFERKVGISEYLGAVLMKVRGELCKQLEKAA